MVHGFLNLCQSSIANKRGHLRMFVHTRNDEILTVGRKAHVPQNYLEYLGFMDELLEKGKRVCDQPHPREIRLRVMKQIERLELGK